MNLQIKPGDIVWARFDAPIGVNIFQIKILEVTPERVYWAAAQDSRFKGYYENLEEVEFFRDLTEAPLHA